MRANPRKGFPQKETNSYRFPSKRSYWGVLNEEVVRKESSKEELVSNQCIQRENETDRGSNKVNTFRSEETKAANRCIKCKAKGGRNGGKGLDGTSHCNTKSI